MAHIDEGLSLNEVALKLKIAPTWINDLQRKTGIPKPIGRKGERVYFTQSEVRDIYLAYILRKLDYGYSDIKKLKDSTGETEFLRKVIDETYARIEEQDKFLKGLIKNLTKLLNLTTPDVECINKYIKKNT